MSYIIKKGWPASFSYLGVNKVSLLKVTFRKIITLLSTGTYI
jgi:hypothetical protein